MNQSNQDLILGNCFACMPKQYRLGGYKPWYIYSISRRLLALLSPSSWTKLRLYVLPSACMLHPSFSLNMHSELFVESSADVLDFVASCSANLQLSECQLAAPRMASSPNLALLQPAMRAAGEAERGLLLVMSSI